MLISCLEKEKVMKTNVSIELSEEQRLNLGQKFHKSVNKHHISRKELTEIVQSFILELLVSRDAVEKSVENLSTPDNEGNYFFNDTQVTQKEWNDGIIAWFEERKLT